MWWLPGWLQGWQILRQLDGRNYENEYQVLYTAKVVFSSNNLEREGWQNTGTIVTRNTKGNNDANTKIHTTPLNSSNGILKVKRREYKSRAHMYTYNDIVML